MATTTTPSSPTNGSNEPARNAADFLDLADSGSQKATQAELAARVEQKRVEHERQRAAQRALFEAQMKALEEEQQREEAALLDVTKGGSPAPAAANGNGNGTATAPSSPPKAAAADLKPAPIGPPSGFKSMPASRRPSGGSKDDLTFGLSKLSLTSAASPSIDQARFDPKTVGGRASAEHPDPYGAYGGKFGFEEGGASGNPSININSDSPSWPSFPGGLETQTVPLTGRAPGSTNVSPRVSTAGVASQNLRGSSPGVASLADSISTLPSMNTRSVPGTPQVGFAPSSAERARTLAGLAGGFGAVNVSQSGLISPSIHAGGDKTPGLGASSRGFSNPDLTQAFSRSLGAGFQKSGDDYTSLSDDFGVVDPNVYQSIGLGGRSRGMSQYGGFDYDARGSFSIDNKIDGLGGVKHKRAELDRDTEFNRFAGTRIEDLQGEILPLCKDQHGCRYLQKKLEEGVPEHRDMIFRETYGHFSDLMTDPFGNYLCQKLLEHTTDEQRNAICESVAPDLVTVSLNMHGTRAVQKMIDFLSTPRQIHSIIMALQASVVPLIKDLNGNHVIQKCLNRLVPEDNQFIYNAVAAHCVEVATHRHGCCVLQRCIDHAADSQRVQLVTEITYHGLTLVQDPFGNYVVQYVLDLNDNRFSDAVTRQFFGNVCALSVQKFSSNVIEKCIRVAEPETRKALIAELLNRNRLEKLLRDSFANYVVQTALDYAEPGQRMLLVECIRPILPMIRNTPYGKRIQSKLQREHMEHHHPYGGGGGGGGGGYNHNQQAALLNLALGGGGGMNMMTPPPVHAPHRHIGNPALHHPNALAEAYGGRGLGGAYNNGGGQHGLQHAQLDHFGNPSGGQQQQQQQQQYGGLGGNGGFGMGGGLGEYNQQQQHAGFSYGGM